MSVEVANKTATFAREHFNRLALLVGVPQDGEQRPFGSLFILSIDPFGFGSYFLESTNNRSCRPVSLEFDKQIQSQDS